MTIKDAILSEICIQNTNDFDRTNILMKFLFISKPFTYVLIVTILDGNPKYSIFQIEKDCHKFHTNFKRTNLPQITTKFR